MDDLEISGAPGCFGIGLLYKTDSNECAACPFGQMCQPRAEAQLALLRGELGIVIPAVKKPAIVKGATPTVSPTPFSTGLPKKVAELLQRIDKAGIKVTEALAEGRNPFTSKPHFMRVTCHLLLKLGERGLPRDLLCTCFMEKLQWSKGTADAHVIQAVQTLKALGAANEIDGTLRLRKMDQ